MRRSLLALTALAFAMLNTAQPALACGGLIGSNGSVQLLRTSTFVGYEDGVEHYVTAFKFVGAGGAFGSIIPLPGVPTKVERGGDWTLQRLARETEPPSLRSARFDAVAAAEAVQVLLDVRIDALDITVLRGGGVAVGQWAKERGFRLSPDAPEVLDFYADRSPIFLAAVFDGTAAAARGQRIGDGTPVHITIPTTNPWVPLRILGLGKTSAQRIEADVYLLTGNRPSLLPTPFGNGMRLAHSAPATDRLLGDLRADKGMGWIPQSGWLSKLRVDATVGELTYDLAVDATGTAAPSRVAAGLEPPAPATPPPADTTAWLVLAGWIALLPAVTLFVRRGAFATVR